MQIQDKLNILKQLIIDSVRDSLSSLDLVKDFKSSIAKPVDEMAEGLRQASDEYSKALQAMIRPFDFQIEELVEKEHQLQYLQQLKSGNDATQFCLLKKNFSLVKMHFTKEEELPKLE